MDLDRLYRLTSLTLVTGCLALGLAACGSSDDGSPDGNQSNGSQSGKADESTPAAYDQGGSGDQGGEIKPEKKAPDSAKDKRGKAPDDVVSDRPGGPGDPQPVSP